jgi:hypothetical protein
MTMSTGSHDLLGEWIRLEGSLQRFAEYVQASAGKHDATGETYARLGLAVHVRPLIEEAYRLAVEADVIEQFLRLFSGDKQQKDAMTAVTEIEHSLGAVVLLTGFVEGHVKAMTLAARITEEAEAYARERVKSERIGFQPPPRPDAG